jgi:hypothetical protein
MLFRVIRMELNHRRGGLAESRQQTCLELPKIETSNLLEGRHISNLLEVLGNSGLQVVYLDSFLWTGWVGDVSAGRPIGGRGGGIPRLLDMMMTSAIAMLETA